MSFSDDLQESKQPQSWEDLGHKMYSKEHLEFHTEIVNPDAMSFLDSTAEFVADNISPSAGKFMKGFLRGYRQNMVAYKRQRAHETESMVKAQVEEERKTKNLQDLMTGMNR